MEKVMAFKIPKGADSPKGPDRALKEAVALLVPFDFTPKKRPGLDTSELLEADPEGIATAFVMNLAKHLNAFLYGARFGQRGRDVFAKMEKLRGMLVKLSREISSLDDWTRFHLQDDRGKLETKFLPHSVFPKREVLKSWQTSSRSTLRMPWRHFGHTTAATRLSTKVAAKTMRNDSSVAPKSDSFVRRSNFLIPIIRGAPLPRRARPFTPSFIESMNTQPASPMKIARPFLICCGN